MALSLQEVENDVSSNSILALVLNNNIAPHVNYLTRNPNKRSKNDYPNWKVIWEKVKLQ